MGFKDDNDRLMAGALPRDPFEGTVPVTTVPSTSSATSIEPAPTTSNRVAPEPFSLGVADFFATCTDTVEYVFEPFIIRRGFVLVMGAPKSGKTWFACWLAAAVAAVDNQRVFIVEEEGSKEVLRDRLKPFLSPEPAAFNHNLRVVFRKGVRLDQREWLEQLVKACEGASLIVLDPFVGLHNQDENDQSQINVVLSHIQELITRTGASVVLIHHTRKGGSWERGSSASASSADARGSGALVGAVDSVIAVKGVPDQERCEGEVRFYVENTDTRVGAPFSRRLAAVKLTGGIGSLDWLDDPGVKRDGTTKQETTEDLLARGLEMLPTSPDGAVSRARFRAMLSIKQDRAMEVVELGIRRGCICEVANRGIYRVTAS